MFGEFNVEMGKPKTSLAKSSIELNDFIQTTAFARKTKFDRPYNCVKICGYTIKLVL